MERNCKEEQRFPNFEFGSSSRIVYLESPTKDMDVKETRELCEMQEYMFSKILEVPLTSENQESPVYQEEIKIGSKVEILRKSSQQYKVHNEYLNEANDKLMQTNRILREDLEEVNGHYQELIIIAKEALKRKKNAQKFTKSN